MDSRRRAIKGELDLKLVTVAEMLAVEQEADASGLTYSLMMEHAGRGLAEVVDSSYSQLREAGVVGLIGSGNNGGDALVALALLADWGWKSSAYIIRGRSKDDPLVERALQSGVEISNGSNDPDFGLLEKAIREHAVILDGVLGTGIKLPLRGKVADVLSFVRDKLNSTPGRAVVVAVDCPSGVDCESGNTAEDTIPASMTVTMAAVKTGLLEFPANNLIGELKLVGIGLDDAEKKQKTWLSIKRKVVDADWARELLPERPRDSHKGTFGTALIVAGSVNYTGAALLSGKAAYRAGAGLVTLAVPAPLHPALAGQFPEATWLLLPDAMGVIGEEAVGVIYENLGKATALLIGPGFGLEDETEKFLARLFKLKSQRAAIGFIPSLSPSNQGKSVDLPPTVIDADGLKLLSRFPGWTELLPKPAILTPHPGEMAILAGTEVKNIQSNRTQTAERFSAAWGHVVVLKGANTVIAAPDGRLAVVPVATSALARAGTGDVLAGMIVGLRAQRMDAYEAAVLGCWLHAQSGLKAARLTGTTASIMAGDLLETIPAAIEDLEKSQG
jgi:ADP-dependent NAD(P)H-hydrate dehydratase / NAD(P)H-hydrate epimerase